MKRYTKWLSVSLALIMLLTLLPGCGKNPTGNGEQIGTDPRDTLRVALTSEPPSLGIYDHSAFRPGEMRMIISSGMSFLLYSAIMRPPF